MVTTASLRTHSLSDLGQSLPETIERVGQSDEAEVITVDGKPRAVLLSLTTYQELTRNLLGHELDDELSDDLTDEDVRVMRRSIEQLNRGEYVEAGAFFDQLHAELLALQAKEQAGRDRA